MATEALTPKSQSFAHLEIAVLTDFTSGNGEDRYINYPNELLWGVFDGLSLGNGRGGEAAQHVADTIKNTLSSPLEVTPQQGLDELVASFDTAQRRLRMANILRGSLKRGGATNGGVLRFIEGEEGDDSALYVASAFVGDAHGYILDSKKGFHKLNTPEVNLNRSPSNFFGWRKGEVKHPYERVAYGYHGVDSYNQKLLEVPLGSRFALATDGISGLRETALSNEEIQNALELPTAQEIASELLRISRVKKDDKTVIVGIFR